MNTIEALKWRYAVKSFDANKKLTVKQIGLLQECLLLSASSMGMQLMEFIIIENQDLKNTLKPFSYNQSQISDCSHLVVMCRKSKAEQSHIDEVIERVSEVRQINTDSLKGYAAMMGTSLQMNPLAQKNWMENQVYLALGNLLTICAIEKIDACPIEGFIREKYNEVLELPKKGLEAVVVCALGFRALDDKYATVPKVRKKKEQLFQFIN
jgi:nitroreductase / dihydropteridine reductase